jgi:hypothetical protein
MDNRVKCDWAQQKDWIAVQLESPKKIPFSDYEKMINWCQTNFNNPWSCDGFMIYFSCKTDAALFKLVMT